MIQAATHSTVLLAQPIPCFHPHDATCYARIKAIADLVPSLANESAGVFIVDQFDGFLPVDMLADGVHPNANGEHKMAMKWFKAISRHCIVRQYSTDSLAMSSCRDLFSRYNFLFLLSGGGKYSYQGTKRWIEDTLESTGGYYRGQEEGGHV